MIDEITVKTQEVLLDMLKEFNKICKDNNLTYFALGGTLLGAVRHNGFIPWDDDIDLGMPRSDYEKIKELIGNKLIDDKYVLETPLTNKDYVYPYCKFYNINTILVENTRHKIKRGINIDIFPLDGLGNTEEEAINNFNEVDKKEKLLLTKICAINKNKSFKRNMAILIGRMIPNFICSKDKCLKNVDECAKKIDYESSIYIANAMGNWGLKEIAKKEWFNEVIDVKFVDTIIKCPEGYDEYLTHVYGNYMQLPPIEKQKSHHDFLEIDFNNSYLNK